MMQLNEFIENARNGSVDLVEHAEKIIEKCNKINDEYNYFNTISKELAIEQAKSLQKEIKNKDKSLKNKKLLGIAVSIKDSICVKGVESTAGSRILKGYRPLFNATAVE